MNFYKIVFALLVALSIQGAHANQDYPGIIDGNGYAADQSGLLAGLYTVKAGFFKASDDAMATNYSMSREFVKLNEDLRSYCGDYMSKRDWTNSYWVRTDGYAADYVLYEKQAVSNLAGLDASIAQLRSQERAECAHLTRELIDVRNDMSLSWQACSEDYHMLKNDWHKTAYVIEDANGRFYVEESWLDGVQSCHDRSYVRRSNYLATYGNLEARLDDVIADIRTCYRLN